MRTAYGQDYGGGIHLPSPTPALKRLMIALAAVWLVQMLLPSGVERWLVTWFGINPSSWFSLPVLLPVWQLVTYSFLHSEALTHILWNLLYLYFFGTMLEGLVGSRRFLSTYFAGVAAGAVGSLIWKLSLGIELYTVGASAGCLAVLVAAAVLRPRAQVLLIFVPIQLAWLAVGLVAIDLLAAMRQLAGESSSYVDNLAHLAGAGFGFLAARRGWIWVDPTEVVAEKMEHRKEVTAQRTRERLDDLLRRIHEDGIGSLSEKERAFLKRMSSR